MILKDKAQWRTTVTYVQGGQERPYAPTVNVVRVLFEWNRCGMQEELIPCEKYTMEAVRDKLRGLQCGFTSFERSSIGRPLTMEEHFRTHLVYLTEVEPGLWEFRTESEYTG